MRRRWSGRVHPWPGAEGDGLAEYRQTVPLLAHRRLTLLERTVRAASLPEMAGRTCMVIALTRAFWRPSATECVRNQDLFLLSLCVWILQRLQRLPRHTVFCVWV